MTICDVHKCEKCGKEGALNCIETDERDKYDCRILEFYRFIAAIRQDEFPDKEKLTVSDMFDIIDSAKRKLEKETGLEHVSGY